MQAASGHPAPTSLSGLPLSNRFMPLFLYLFPLSTEGADAMAWRLQASSVSKSGPAHPTQLSVTVDGHSQHHPGHTTTTDQIPHPYPKTQGSRSISASANAMLSGSPPYPHATQTMTNRHNTSTAAAKLIVIKMMGSDLQSMKRCGGGCNLCSVDQRGTRYGRSVASSCWRKSNHRSFTDRAREDGHHSRYVPEAEAPNIGHPVYYMDRPAQTYNWDH
jgi:hypothetical protein